MLEEHISNTLAAFGIENPQTSFRSMDDDEFTFEIKQDITQVPLFTFGDRISLFKTANGTTTCWFIGTITKTMVIGSAETEAIKYVASGPWWQLKRTLWQTPCWVYNPISCAPQQLPLSGATSFFRRPQYWGIDHNGHANHEYHRLRSNRRHRRRRGVGAIFRHSADRRDKGSHAFRRHPSMHAMDS